MYIRSAMDFLKDIFVNLLSDGLWAVGAFLLAKFLFLKKSLLFRLTEHDLKKNLVG